MTDEKPPIKPLKSYMRGVAIPGIIILGCVAIGVLISILSGNFSLIELWDAAQLGAFAGFFISIIGVLDMVAALLFSDRRFMNGVYMSLGYLTVWFVTAYALGFFGEQSTSFNDIMN